MYVMYMRLVSDKELRILQWHTEYVWISRHWFGLRH